MKPIINKYYINRFYEQNNHKVIIKVKNVTNDTVTYEVVECTEISLHGKRSKCKLERFSYYFKYIPEYNSPLFKVINS